MIHEDNSWGLPTRLLKYVINPEEKCNNSNSAIN